jgi:hypothetical protein
MPSGKVGGGLSGCNIHTNICLHISIYLNPVCCCVPVCLSLLQEKWEEGYYITAMAGSMSSASLVVMSKGTPYTQQSYKV